MKAVRIHGYGGPEVLVYEDVDVPTPGPDQVLVRVKAAAVNPVDVAVRTNSFPTPRQPPKTLGSDGAGVVEAVGADVQWRGAGRRGLLHRPRHRQRGQLRRVRPDRPGPGRAQAGQRELRRGGRPGPRVLDRLVRARAPRRARRRRDGARAGRRRAASAAPPCSSPTPVARACWPRSAARRCRARVRELGADEVIDRTRRRRGRPRSSASPTARASTSSSSSSCRPTWPPTSA